MHAIVEKMDSDMAEVMENYKNIYTDFHCFRKQMAIKPV